MGGKAPQAGTATTPRVAGPPVLQRNLGPRLAGMRQSQDSFRDTAAPIVGTVASVIGNIFTPGLGAAYKIAAERTVREQLNTINGRPVLESTEKPLQDWPSLLGATAGGYAGGAVGGAAGAAAGGAGSTAAQAGSAVGGYAGSAAGGYAGGVAQRALYGGTRAQQIGNILGRILGTQGGAYGQLGAYRAQGGYGG